MPAMFAIGSTVKNKLNSKIATVTGILDDGKISVRFDGESELRAIHHTRFEAHVVVVSFDKPFEKVDPETFKKGDFIRVTDAERTVQGAALNQLDSFGYSHFEMLTDDGQYLEFNANHVSIVVLFRADIARGQLPKY